jgi:hypothetical protein
MCEIINGTPEDTIMFTRTRREFLQSAAAGAVLGLSDLRAFLPLSPANADDAKVTPELVRLSGDIEPIVRLIEETPRDKCLPVMVEQLRGGLPYRQFLAALFLAGIRNVNPQPVGFKLHCVFVIHSANQLSLDARAEERLLPLFFALDNFKKSQAEDEKQGDFRLTPVQGKLPEAEKAWEEFHAAMESWDQPRADRAIAVLARTRGAHDVMEGLWRYGARDYRNIGHKAIFVANSWRTLETIGWQHAEPTLRSLVLGLLDFGKQKQVNGYAYEDQAYLPNLERARKAAAQLPGEWAMAQGNRAITEETLALLREGKIEDVCRNAVSQLREGKARAQAFWDAVHLAAGELMMRQPGIIGLHTVTSANALHYAFRTSASPETRLLMLLQGLGWIGQFRNFMVTSKQKMKDIKITELTAGEIPGTPGEAVTDILGKASRGSPERTAEAARKAFRFAQAYPEAEPFLQGARRLVITRANEAHDYKYPAAIFEDYRLVSAEWRPHMLATAIYYQHGSDAPESAILKRAREAVGTK